MKIITNNIPRPILQGYQIPGWRKDFDYLNDIEFEEHDFFMYKGHMYDISEFVRFGEHNDGLFSNWDAVLGQSYFDGILIRLSENNEQIIVGRFYE